MTTPIHRGRRRTSTNNGRPRAPLIAGAGVALWLVAQACGAANIRPFFTHLPDAVIDTVRADADAVIRQLAQQSAAQGLRVARASPEEGYLETDWYDIEARRPGGRYTFHPTRVIRLRFYADPAGAGDTQLASEVVYRRTIDPSLPVRETEVMAPPEHPGTALLMRILEPLGRAGR